MQRISLTDSQPNALDSNNRDTSNSNAYRSEVGMMELDKLIQDREEISDEPFIVSDDELLARYEKLYIGVVNDVLREFGLLDQALPHHIVPLREYRTIAGFAFTVKSAPSCQITGEMGVRAKMLDQLSSNAFVVWDTSRDEKATLWGGVMTAAAKRADVKAACIDGGIRDTHQILDVQFPVFYRYRISNGSLGRCLITHYQVPIRIGDVDVKPGDIVLGDVDGVLCVPRQIACRVLGRAEQVKANEKKILGWVNEGHSASEITNNGGYF